MHVEGFYINYDGEPTVGLPDAEWEITGGFHFDTPEELQQFKDGINAAFEAAHDGPLGVETFEEREAREVAEFRKLSFIRFKWGGVKSIQNLNPEAQAIYDTMDHESKEDICRLIDASDCELNKWWDESIMTKEEAKKYVLEYDNE